jgi:Na+-transporting NADH:ubiquinone oxidoreductase subunit C
MSDRLKSVVFAAVMCLVVSLLLTTASTGLQRFQQQNVLIDKHKNILQSVGLIEPGQKMDAEAIETLYSESIKPLWVDPSGQLIKENERGEQSLPVYVHTKNDHIEAYIIPINSRGLWGRILGYLALEDDGSTVAGFTVYKHSETPGLGGEIEKRWFQKNWIGKQIIDQSGDFVSVGIAKGKVEEVIPEDKRPHYVDGISGATLTGKYLTSGIRKTLEQYEPVSVKFRNNPAAKRPLKPSGS